MAAIWPIDPDSLAGPVAAAAASSEPAVEKSFANSGRLAMTVTVLGGVSDAALLRSASGMVVAPRCNWRATVAMNNPVELGHSKRLKGVPSASSRQPPGTCFMPSRSVVSGSSSTSIRTGSKQASSSATASGSVSTCFRNWVEAGLHAAVNSTST